MHFLLCTGIYPPEIGGPATVISDLAEQLNRGGHDVTVITYGDSLESSEKLQRVSRKGFIVFRYLAFALAVRRALRSDTQIVCTDVFSTGIPVRAALMGRANKLFVRLGGEWCWEDAVTKRRFHNTLRAFWSQPHFSLRDRLMRLNYGWILNRAKRIYLTSEFLREIVCKIVPSATSRMYLVPNVARPMEIGGRAQEPPHRPLRLLYVGRFAPVKNVPFLGSVLRALHETDLSVACTFAGDGPELEIVKSLLCAVPQMDFLGPVPAPALHHLFTKSDLLVLPSLSDICPNVVLEALAARLPCIITTEHGLGRLEGVIELHPLDLTAWKNAISSLSDPAAYEALRARACLSIEDQRVNLADKLIQDASEPG